MPKTIFIIEDDDFFRELLRKKFSSSNFQVAEINSGKGAAEAVKDKHPDLVILDLLLPDIDGFEVLGRLKADSSLSKIPVIILSNLGQQEDIDKGMKLGATDFLIKSQFDIDQVVEKINSILK